MEMLYTVKFNNGNSFQALAPENLPLQKGAMCVVKRDFYSDVAKVMIAHGPFKELNTPSSEMPHIIHFATPEELTKADECLKQGKGAYPTVLEHIERLNLPMKLVNVHYSIDGKLITIQFTADGRVDFRELVKELSRSLSCRIELRQIGVRDETAIHGGIGICGQELCCARYLKDFQSINVRMAKEQDLSLTPGTISGCCGRLKCCLKYEYEGYLELEKNMPRCGEFCECAEGRGKIFDRNLLTQELVIQLEDTGNLVRHKLPEVKLTGRGDFRRNNNNNNNSGDDLVPEMTPELAKILDEAPANSGSNANGGAPRSRGNNSNFNNRNNNNRGGNNNNSNRNERNDRGNRQNRRNRNNANRSEERRNDGNMPQNASTSSPEPKQE
ncbi:MAG: hypothetical protein MST10_07670 [Lentisphaeria bacterium]|nr:hypothetical protein [Lentisphaeria bacterium]